MGEDLKNLIENNPGVSFVVMVYSEQELEELFDVLKEKKYSPYPPISLDELKKNAVEEFGFTVGFKINQFNHSVGFNDLKHWQEFEKDIVKYGNEGFEFIK